MQLQLVKDKVSRDPYTLAVFTSPSGDGLKVLVRVDSDQKDHKLAFQQIAEHFDKVTGVKCDPSGKDITRLCFFSYDPDAYSNPDAVVFPVQRDNESIANLTSANWKVPFLNAVGYTSRIHLFEEGNRNNFIFQLACNARREGIPVNEAKRLISLHYGYEPMTEVMATIESAYETSEADSVPRIEKPIRHSMKNEDWTTMPKITEGLIEDLPEPLKSYLKAFADSKDRDLAFLSLLSIIAMLNDKVKIIYGDLQIYAPFYVMIVAPPASGKGRLSDSRQIGEMVIAKQRETQFQREIQHLANSYVAAQDPNCAVTMRPMSPGLKFISGNSSHSALLECLESNDGSGILYESEADTVTGALEQDWGNSSDTYRKAFHHEVVTFLRINGREISILNPKLGILLSGTPDQLTRLLRSVENGLVSRFIFYFFKSPKEWKSQFHTGNARLEPVKQWVADELVRFQQWIDQFEAEVVLTSEQIARFDEFFAELSRRNDVQESDPLFGSVKRLGVVAAKWLIIFSALRVAEKEALDEGVMPQYDRDLPDSEEVCEPESSGEESGDETTQGITWSILDDDLELVLTMIERLYSHTVVAHDRIRGHQRRYSTVAGNDAKSRFLAALPKNFERKDAEVIGKAMGLSQRTITNYLNDDETAGMFTKLKMGLYQRKPASHGVE